MYTKSCPIPVSYTHLDVYKRQLSGWSLKKLIEKFGVHNVLSEKVAENKLLVFMLDVYKRQNQRGGQEL